MKILVCTIAALLLAVTPTRAAAGTPYATDIGQETALIAGGAALLGAGLRAQRGFRPLSPQELAALDPRTLPAPDRSAVRRWSPAANRASDVLAWTVALAPLGLTASGPGRDQAGRLVLMYAQTALLTDGAVHLLKNVVRRPRPLAYNPDPRIPDELRLSPTARRSFPSGHTARTFAAMVFFAGVHERLVPEADHGRVWGGCLAAAAATGTLRWAAGRHFPTDILAGAALGAAVGWLVPRLHERGGGEVGGTPAPAARLAFGFAF
ncbi:MAG: phosphatase PAP2 family protein [Candidatus Krumholzibacteriia bacterium]